MQSSHRQHAYQDPHGKIEAAVSRLRDIRLRADRIMQASLQTEQTAHADRVTAMLTGAAEVLFGNPQPTDNEGRSTGPRPDIVFAEFEGEDFGDWKPEGEAFATGPTVAGFSNQLVSPGRNW
jgi:hypothetical protein